MNILTRLNRRLYNISEAEGLHGENPDQPEGSEEEWKNPMGNPRETSYDRQRAEDALFHTVQPLTKDSRWVNAAWSAPTEPPPEFEPGGPAPQWTPTEVIVAMAGDPSLLHERPEDLAKLNPEFYKDERLKDRWRPGYGRMGGAPLYRMARKIARQYKRANDENFISDLYGNGLTQLAIMLQPGYDIGTKPSRSGEGEVESPFVSYVFSPIMGAMRHGVGGSQQARDAVSSTGYNTRMGMRALMREKDPDKVRRAASAVKGKYRLGRSHDKHKDNPYGVFSPAFYQLAMEYAAALEAKPKGESDEARKDRIEEIRSRMQDFIDNVRDWSTPIRGASTGAGQAISTPRNAGIGVQSIHSPGGGGEEAGSSLGDQLIGDEGEESGFDPETIRYILDIAINNDLGRILKNSEKYQQMAQDIYYKEHEQRYKESMERYEEDMEKYKAKLARYRQNQDVIRRKQQQKQELEAAGEDASHIEVPDPLPEPKPPKEPQKPERTKAKRDQIKIGGAMTGNELRHAIRALGPVGSNYPGRGVMRANTHIPRDARGWWEPGEDPEIEPVPDGGTWSSIWMRNGYPSMASKPTEIVKEFTKEAKEFNELGIASVRGAKVAEGQNAMTKMAAGKHMKSAIMKIQIIKDIHEYELGLDEVEEVEESAQHSLPILEGTTQADRYIIAEACSWMMRRLSRAILEAGNSAGDPPARRATADDRMVAELRSAISEKSPPGWKGSVKAMKKHTDTFSTDEDDEDKINPYALAWSMHKKGAEPHYKDSDKAEKKKKYQNEGIEKRLRKVMVEMAPVQYKGMIRNMDLSSRPGRMAGSLPTRNRMSMAATTVDEDRMNPVDALQHIVD